MSKQNESTMKFKVDISQLKSGMQQAKTAIAGAKAEFDKSAEGLDNWRKSSEGVEAKLKQLRTTLSAQNDVLNNYRKQLVLTEEQYGENSVQAEQLRTKIEQQKSTISKTKSEINKYENSLKEVSQAEALAEKEGISVDDALKKIKKSADDAGDSAEGASGGFTIMKGALASLVADGIKQVIGALKDLAFESETAFDKLQASTGLTTAEFEKYKESMSDLYANNYGESLDDLGQKFAYIKQVTGETDPSKISELTKNAIALEDTFGSDFNETVRGVQNLMNHFGLTSEEAFDLFAKGSQEGLDYTSELGDNVAEYAGNFAQAGFTAEEYFQLLKNGAEGGAYNLDKVNDSINEVKNRLGDGTIKDNLGSFSNDTKTAFNNWENGKGTMKDVIDSIVNDISTATSETDALTMAQVAFGTMGEDANLNVVKSLTSVGDTFSDVKGTMESVDQIRYDNLKSAVSGLGRTLQMELLQPVVDKINPMLTSGIGNIVATLKGQMSIGELMSIGTEWLTNIGNGLVQGIPNLISKGLDMVTNFTASLRANAPALIQSGLEFVHNMVKGLMNALPELIAKVPTIVSNIAGVINDNAPTILKSAFNIVVTIIKGIISAIPTLVANIPKIIKAIVDVWTAFNWASLGKNALTALGNGIKSLGGWFKGIGKGVNDSFVNALKNLPSNLKTLGKSAIQNMGSAITSAKNYVITGAKNIFDAVVNGVKNLPSKMLGIGKDLVRGLWNGISDMTGWVIGKIQGFGDSVLGGIKDFFGIHSPSKVMEKDVGKNIVLGVGKGIEKNSKYAKKITKKFGEDLLSTLEKRLSNYKVYHSMSLEDEANYWNNARKLFKKGTQDRIDADQHYYEVKKEIREKLKEDAEKLKEKEEELENKKITNAENRLAKQKRIREVSALEEASYWKKIVSETKKGSDARKQAEDNYYSALETYKQQYEDYVSSIMSQTSLFEAFEQKDAVGGDTLINNLQSQITSLQDFDTVMSELKGKIGNTNLYSELCGMGTDSLAELQAINSMSEEQLQQYVALYDEKYSLAKQKASEKYGEITTVVKTGNKKIVSNTETTLSSVLKFVNKYMLSIGSSVASSVTKIQSQLLAMRSAVSEINSLASQSGSGGSSGSGVTNVTYNFNQTNNSPKSLTRTEIYRQSKNLLLGAVGVQ